MYDDVKVKDRRFEAQYDGWDTPKYRHAFSRSMGRFIYIGLAVFSMMIVGCILGRIFL